MGERGTVGLESRDLADGREVAAQVESLPAGENKSLGNLSNQKKRFLAVSLTAFLGAFLVLMISLASGPHVFATSHEVDFLKRLSVTPPLKTHGEKFNLFHLEVTLLFIAFVSLTAAILKDGVFIFSNFVTKHANTFLVVLVALSVILLSSFALFVLQDFPNSADEYAYIFQSQTFLEKRLWNEPHPVQEFFSFAHIAQIEGKWVSRFPPGWPLVLAIGSSLRIPLWLINPFLGTLSIVFLFALARRIYNLRVAMISVVSILFSGFFIFNSASYFSHTLCGLLIILFFYCELRFIQEDKKIYALSAGFFLGFAFITRYYSTLLCAFPLGLHLLLQGSPKKFTGLLWTFLGSIPFLFFTLLYNYKITGNALLFVTTWMDPNEKLGFVDGYSWNLAWIYLVKHLQSFVYWTSPPILFLYFGYIIHSFVNKSIRSYDLPLIFIVIGYLFWHTYGGNQYGPRFYYEAYPFVILFVVARLFGETPFVTPRPFQRIALAIFLVGLVWGASAIPVMAKREHQIISERMDLYRSVEQANIHEAIIFLKSGTGVMRPMPARDLARNGTGFENDVLYARDLGADNAKLKAYFPNKEFYMYFRDKNKQNGRLIALEQNQKEDVH